jgi:hypothetical protein
MTRCFVLAMPFAPELCSRSRKAKPKAFPTISSLGKEGRQSAERRGSWTASSSDAARTLTPVLPLRRGPGPDPDRARPHGAGALAFRRPTAALRRAFGPARLRPRFLELPDASGRTLSGTSAASTSQSGHAPDGTMPKPPVSAVYGYAAREPPPLRLKEYPREWRPSSSGILYM